MNSKINHSDRSCRATTRDGTPCTANVQEGEVFCFFHDPNKADERRAAQARGGQGNRMPTVTIDLPDFDPKTVSDVRPLLVGTINQVRRGELSPAAATAISNLANLLMKTLEEEDFRGQLQEFRQQLAQTMKKKRSYDPDGDDANGR